MTNYIPTIGIEVHVELKTKTKIFSPSVNGYGEMANSLTNVIDLGYPGTLPTLNKEVVNLAIKAATVLNCKIRRGPVQKQRPLPPLRVSDSGKAPAPIMTLSAISARAIPLQSRAKAARTPAGYMLPISHAEFPAG